MVFAIAVLLFQAAPTPPPVLLVTSVPAVNTVATSKSPTATPTTASKAAPTAPNDEVIVANNADNTATMRMNLSSVKLDGSDSKTGSSYSLNSVSLESPQNAKTFSTIRIPEPNATRGDGIKSAKSYPSNRMWLALSITQHGAAVLDAYSTRAAIEKGAVEDDPMMRPFARSPAIYAAIQVGPVLLDIVTRRMLRSENGFVRHMWWVPESAATTMYLFSGVHNLGVARRAN
jgi:hypothetical protein